MTLLSTVVVAAVVAMPQRARAEWNVRDDGAVGDGISDDTAAFQRTLDEAGNSGGGIVHVPAGKYRIAGHLSIPSGVTLQGTFRLPPNDVAMEHGSTLLAYAGRGSRQGEPFIRLAGNAATVAGLIVFYPEWKKSDVPPVPYPPCIKGEHFDNMGVLDCCIVNAYEALHFKRAGRNFVRNVYGYPAWRGLYVDECYDIGRVENCHFWPFGVRYQQDDPYCRWVNTNAVAFEFGRTDWHYVLNTFCFGYGVGYKFAQTTSGSCNGNFLGIGADSCRRAIFVEQAQTPGLLITNGEFVGRWGSRDSLCIEIGAKCQGKVSLTNCSFWGPHDRCIWLRSPKGQITANACNFVNWDNTARGAPAIQLDGGRAILQGNTFGDQDLDILIGDDVRSTIVIGNQSTGGLSIENLAGERTQVVANEAHPASWTEEAKSNYRIDVGSEGDSRYLRRWHRRERIEGAEPHSMRWSSSVSDILLPVLPDADYQLKVDAYVPEGAVRETIGLYLGEAQIVAPTKSGNVTLTAQIRSSRQEELRLQLRCRSWNEDRNGPSSRDPRQLGIQVRSISMRSSESNRVFDANTGEWITDRE